MVIQTFLDGQKCMYDGYLINLLDAFKTAVQHHNTSAFILIDGKSGKGKTTLAVQIGKYLSENNLSLYFDPQDFLKGLATAKPETFHVLDESMLLSNRASLTELNRTMVHAMSMIRSKRLYIVFCVNSIFDLDRNFVLSRADCLLHVYADGLYDRGKFCAFFKAKGDKYDRLKDLYMYGRKYYSYSKPHANFYAKFTSKFLINEKKYEADKQKSVNEFLMSGKLQTASKYREAFKKIIKYLKKDKYKILNISEMSGISTGTISTILKENDERKER